MQKNSSMKKKFSNIIKGDGKTIIMLYGEVGEGCSVDSSRVVSELFAHENQDCKIEVRINSQGGDVFSGMAIYNALRQSKGDITIYIDGVAASIAAIIALCGKPLLMSPYAKLMLQIISKIRKSARQNSYFIACSLKHFHQAWNAFCYWQVFCNLTHH